MTVLVCTFLFTFGFCSGYFIRYWLFKESERQAWLAWQQQTRELIEFLEAHK